MYRNNKIGIAVPAYNEEELIQYTLLGIPDYVDRIYVCNDGSTDRTKEKVEEIAKGDPRVFLINHESNIGVGGAIVDCHKKSLEEGMAIIAVMAGDDQMDPAYLPQLFDPLVDGEADYSKGNRLYIRNALHGMSKWRLIGNRMLTILTKVVTGNWNISDPQNGYTAITAEALQRLPLDSLYRGYLFENDMLIKLNSLNMRIMDIPIPARYGNEISSINYSSFVTRGIVFMVRGYLWRLRNKYLTTGCRPLVLSSVSGALAILIGGVMISWGINGGPTHDQTVTVWLITALAVGALGALAIASWGYYKKTQTSVLHRRS